MRRAIGIVRVSRTRGREGDTFASPTEQTDRITQACEREHLTLLRIVEELDVSGGASLEDRPGLRPAVEAVEHGDADVIVAAYFDRFFRSTKVQAQVLERVEAAGGRVLAVDVGTVTSGTAGQWLSASMLGIVSEYYRRSNAERVRGALVAAIARGVAPYGHVPAGYERDAHGRYQPSRDARAVADAFHARAAGETVEGVWTALQTAGITITYSGTYQLLQSRVYLGEIHFGTFTPNLHAHEPIIDRDTWDAVQRARVPSGRKPQSDRLLARLGVLLCGTCGSRLAGSTATGSTSRGGGGGKTYPIYRCGNKTCERPVSISAQRVEAEVVRQLRAEFADVQGRASAGAAAAAADAQLEHAQRELDTAIRVLSVVGDEPIAIERLAGLRDARDRARGDADRLRGVGAANAINVADDWDRLTLAERRAAIDGTVQSVHVAPGRGRDRVSVEFLG